MGATLLDGVVMEPGSIVAAGAVVPPGELADSNRVNNRHSNKRCHFGMCDWLMVLTGQ
jgi:carbonic anhydrase/acetyltransferase-like protein (isoleucine patch superfamily)